MALSACAAPFRRRRGRWTTWWPACVMSWHSLDDEIWNGTLSMGNETTIASDHRDRSSRREQNKAENRTALLKAARAVFAEMGHGAASVRDIVRRTDLASGTFYNYFKDKDEIFEAVVGELTGELLRRHQNGRARARTTEEFFRSHYSVYFGFLSDDPELLALSRRSLTAVRTLIDKPDVRATHRG